VNENKSLSLTKKINPFHLPSYPPVALLLSGVPSTQRQLMPLPLLSHTVSSKLGVHPLPSLLRLIYSVIAVFPQRDPACPRSHKWGVDRPTMPRARVQPMPSWRAPSRCHTMTRSVRSWMPWTISGTSW
jgi:hypothetical protein